MQWFRLYHEIKDDPKMGMLPDSTFRVFIEAMCWASQVRKNGSTGIKKESCNWAFRRDVTCDIEALLQMGVLTINSDGEITVFNWEIRQKSSDTSAVRTKAYREKKKENVTVTSHVTGGKRHCDALEERRVEENRKEKTNTGAGEPAGNVIVLELSGDDQKTKARKDKGSLEELKTFAVQELNLPESDAEWLFDKWEGNGWSNNKSRIKDWKATMRSWHRMGNIFPSQKQIQNGNNGYRQPSFPKAQEAMES